MSAGPFALSRYQSSELKTGGAEPVGFIMPVKIQPETALAFVAGTANSAPTAPVTLGLRATISKSTKAHGVHCRKVTLRFTGTAPAGYTGDDLTIPALSEAFYNACNVGATGTYLGSQVVVVSRRPEFVK